MQIHPRTPERRALRLRRGLPLLLFFALTLVACSTARSPDATLGHRIAVVVSANTTKLDVGRWPESLRPRVRVDRIVSGDRDLLPADLPRLREHFRASAGDWESGSIAWVAAKNHTPALILRGVSDVVGEHGDALYGNLGGFEAASNKIMSQLIALLSEAVPKLR